MKVTRLLREEGGHDHDCDKANEKGVIQGTEWEVTGGVIYDYVSYYTLEGVEGRFNTVMFSGSWEDHSSIMSHQYRGR